SFKALMRWVIRVGRFCGLGTVWRTMDQDRRRRPFLPQAPHTILEFIAVEPKFQGQGFARDLFDTIHQQAKNGSMAIWLETTRVHNVPIFKHFGYRVIDKNEKNGVDYFFMVNTF
ncbi:hypothetical protein MNBD_CHLOROFLEXI01-550, partial [hydrothermal vent metagenome]